MGTTIQDRKVNYILRTYRRDGVERFVLIDEDRDTVVVQTTYRPLIDWCVAYGVRTIEPTEPLTVNSKQRRA